MGNLVSELRIVLLGGNWSQRNLVKTLILGGKDFTTQPNSFIKITGSVKNRKITVINTPDLQFPTADSLTEFIRKCAAASDPGPHVFLLVLQPESFTEEERNRIHKVLYHFNDESFDHSLVLILNPRQESSGTMEECMKNPPLKDLIIECRDRYLFQTMVEPQELLTRFDQIMNENHHKHVTYEEFEETTTPWGLLAAGEGEVSAFRIVLLGEKENKKTELVNQVIRNQELVIRKPSSHCVAYCGKWKGKPVTMVTFPDLFSLTESKMRAELKSCRDLCYPGPNVLLLLVNPSDFTEEKKKKLDSILEKFDGKALKHSVVIMTDENDKIDSAPILSVSFASDLAPTRVIDSLIKECEYREYNMGDNNHQELMVHVEDIVYRGKGSFLILKKDKTAASLPPLNLVLFGPSEPLKTAAAKVILGHKDLPSECVRKQGEVFGRGVSLVELPALYGKAEQEVMEESFRCVSLCDPEGVHAFILVLPVGPLTDEDKGELHTIQDTFSSRVNDFTIILFTTETDAEHPAVDNFIENRNIQDLIQRCQGRHFVLNIRDRRQIKDLMEMLQKNVSDREKDSSYTTKTLLWGQMEKISQLQAEVNKLKTKTTDSDCLRIVLIGKTGSGKSSSGNTILGRKEFKAEASPQSVTRICQKAECEVDGHHVVVVDTPGLFDNNLTSDQVNEELKKCFSLVSPGPHVFLLVLPIGRFTIGEDTETLELIEEVLGKHYKKFTVVLFTRGDALEYEEISIEHYTEHYCDEACKNLIRDCGGRYHVFNNNQEIKNRSQVTDLIQKINIMMKDNKISCYTREMLPVTETKINSPVCAEKINQ